MVVPLPFPLDELPAPVPLCFLKSSQNFASLCEGEEPSVLLHCSSKRFLASSLLKYSGEL